MAKAQKSHREAALDYLRGVVDKGEESGMIPASGVEAAQAILEATNSETSLAATLEALRASVADLQKVSERIHAKLDQRLKALEDRAAE